MREQLTVWSLNGGRFVAETQQEEANTIRWLRSLSDLNIELPDVLCLQDFRLSLFCYLAPFPHFEFMPMTNHLIFGKRELVGIVIASRYPLTLVNREFTWGDGHIRDLMGIDNNNTRIKPYQVTDRLILQTEARCFLAATVQKEGLQWRIATTHGFWTRGGTLTSEQRESTQRLCECALKDAHKHGGTILLGDLNLDTEGEILRVFAMHGAKDHPPSEITTTLAPSHPAAKFGAKPDRVMVWPNDLGQYPYHPARVVIDFSSGSDHGMLCTIFVRHLCDN